MSDAVLLALIMATPPTLAALAALIVGLRNGHHTAAIKASVDGAASTSVAEIKALRQEIQTMRDVAADKKETAALLAQAVVSKEESK